ncbi:MAG TPA: hypothetical protein VN280_22370 [Variovorax sp.]|nr:hypothetical protein [Variovorax sp.]
MSTETTTGWEEVIPELKIELVADGCLLLTHQDSCGNGDDMVIVHPIHLRFMAEKLGLVREMSASEADNLRTINKLARRLRLLHERISQMDQWLWEHPDSTCVDINTELWFSAASLDLSREFMTELNESGTVETPRGAIPPQSRGDGKFHPSAMARALANGSQPQASKTSPNPPFGAAENPPSVAKRTPGDGPSKACANPSGKASAKASVKPSVRGTDQLFGDDHG